MSDYDWCAIFAVAGLIAVVAWYSCGPAAANDQAAWDASTGARGEDEVHDAVAKARAARTPAVEQEPGDPYSDDRIQLELMFIPRQRTEDHR